MSAFAVNEGGKPFSRVYQLKDIVKVTELSGGVLAVTEESDDGLTKDKSAIFGSISDLYSFVKKYDKEYNAGNPVDPPNSTRDRTLLQSCM